MLSLTTSGLEPNLRNKTYRKRTAPSASSTALIMTMIMIMIILMKLTLIATVILMTVILPCFTHQSELDFPLSRGRGPYQRWQVPPCQHQRDPRMPSTKSSMPSTRTRARRLKISGWSDPQSLEPTAQGLCSKPESCNVSILQPPQKPKKERKPACIILLPCSNSFWPCPNVTSQALQKVLRPLMPSSLICNISIKRS